MSLHNEIMNIQLDEQLVYYQFGGDGMYAYKLGYKIARRKAAELALKYDSEKLLDFLDEFIEAFEDGDVSGQLYQKALKLRVEIK